ncbi:MAG: glycerol acyltransferase [Prevotellaceae bacterium]|jgi:1-acyl-sn-glycerol-3-phosphate acyltransferase|nr:glycerol acyltransferase [Prevotellaceae bacterium]
MIDVEKIIRSKTDKFVPQFLINRLKKIVHQNEINEILAANSDKFGVEFMAAVLETFKIKTACHCHCGLDPQSFSNDFQACNGTKRFIFASNHPLGALEAMAIGKHLGEKFDGNINFVVNNLLTYLTPLESVFTSVNVGSGKQNRQNIEEVENLFSSDKQIVMFPSGTVSRKKHGKIADPEWKKMFISKSRQFERDVVPIFCTGRNSNFFYNLSNFRNFFGIKFNIELLFLPDEMFKNRNSEINITVGKPISYKTFTSKKSDLEWASEVQKTVYELGKKELGIRI